MLAALRRHITYANVIATLALFSALGGVSYAALKLERNSVKAQHIARNAVRASEIATGAVGTDEVANGSLLGEDFRIPPRGIRGPRGDKGATGPQGSRGAVGPRGADGTNALMNVAVRLGTSFDAVPGDGALLEAGCLEGERAIGGGASPVPATFSAEADMTSSFPSPSAAGAIPTAWKVGVQNKAPAGGATVSFQSYAVCVSP
jgi:hypothetical protein